MVSECSGSVSFLLRPLNTYVHTYINKIQCKFLADKTLTLQKVAKKNISESPQN